MSKDSFVEGLSSSGEGGEPGKVSRSNQVPLAADAFVRQMQELNVGWRTSFAEMQKRDLDFAFRLARCATAPEAMQVCAEWMSTRSGSVFEMQKQFFELWMRYASVLPSGAKETGGATK